MKQKAKSLQWVEMPQRKAKKELSSTGSCILESSPKIYHLYYDPRWHEGSSFI